jgi:hypothetical protein
MVSIVLAGTILFSIHLMFLSVKPIPAVHVAIDSAQLHKK